MSFTLSSLSTVRQQSSLEALLTRISGTTVLELEGYANSTHAYVGLYKVDLQPQTYYVLVVDKTDTYYVPENATVKAYVPTDESWNWTTLLNITVDNLDYVQVLSPYSVYTPLTSMMDPQANITSVELAIVRYNYTLPITLLVPSNTTIILLVQAGMQYYEVAKIQT